MKALLYKDTFPRLLADMRERPGKWLSQMCIRDRYIAARPGVKIDYIHGEQVARELARNRRDAIAFLLPPMAKESLFPTVIHDGVLPRKTFSMGEAQEKRFYLEARKIR